MIIELLDGTRYDTADYSLKRLFHYIPSASIAHTNYELQGRGDYINSSRLNNRVIRVEFLYIANDIYDFYSLRDELNDLFMREEEFYIIFKREPFKRWLVKTNIQFEIPPNPDMQSFVVEFITQKRYAESIGTSLDLQNKKEWDVDLWAWNGLIDWDSEEGFTYNSNNFAVNNLGNAEVDPRENPLKIKVKGVFSSFLELENTSTGDIFRYNGNLNNSDELLLDNVRVLKNGTSVFKDTNFSILKLKQGSNEFVVRGGTIQEIVFDFRFLFK